MVQGRSASGVLPPRLRAFQSTEHGAGYDSQRDHRDKGHTEGYKADGPPKAFFQTHTKVQGVPRVVCDTHGLPIQRSAVLEISGEVILECNRLPFQGIERDFGVAVIGGDLDRPTARIMLVQRVHHVADSYNCHRVELCPVIRPGTASPHYCYSHDRYGGEPPDWSWPWWPWSKQ